MSETVNSKLIGFTSSFGNEIQPSELLHTDILIMFLAEAISLTNQVTTHLQMSRQWTPQY